MNTLCVFNRFSLEGADLVVNTFHDTNTYSLRSTNKLTSSFVLKIF